MTDENKSKDVVHPLLIILAMAIVVLLVFPLHSLIQRRVDSIKISSVLPTKMQYAPRSVSKVVMTSIFSYKEEQINPDKDWDVPVLVEYYGEGNVYLTKEQYSSVTGAIEGIKDNQALNIDTTKTTDVTYYRNGLIYTLVSLFDSPVASRYGESQIIVPKNVTLEELNSIKTLTDLKEFADDVIPENNIWKTGEASYPVELHIYYKKIVKSDPFAGIKYSDEEYVYNISDGEVNRVK